MLLGLGEQIERLPALQDTFTIKTTQNTWLLRVRGGSVPVLGGLLAVLSALRSTQHLSSALCMRASTSPNPLVLLGIALSRASGAADSFLSPW